MRTHTYRRRFLPDFNRQYHVATLALFSVFCEFAACGQRHVRGDVMVSVFMNEAKLPVESALAFINENVVVV